jgi:hypothetical protein
MIDPDLPQLPPLGPKASKAYQRFARDLRAFTQALGQARPAGPVHGETLLALNGLILMANRLFRRHPEIPRFFPVGIGQPMALVDLGILIARLNAAAARFEEIHPHLRPGARRF